MSEQLRRKENLINLIEQFSVLGDQAVAEADDNDDNDLNDKMNAIAIAIEKASIDVFGKKVNMDFGMINAIYYNKAEIIQYVQDYIPQLRN